MRALELIGVLIVGALIGLGLAMALDLSEPGATAGDWLQFAGALCGVVATIMGTLWVEAYRSRSRARKERRLVADAIQDISAALENARADRDDSPIAQARLAQLQKEEALLNAFGRFVYARHFVPRDDIDSWQAVEVLWAAMERERPTIQKESEILRDDNDHEAVLNVSISKMDQIAERLESPLDTARDAIAEPSGFSRTLIRWSRAVRHRFATWRTNRQGNAAPNDQPALK